DREHVMSVFGRGRLFGRSGVLVSGVREGGCAFPVPRWRAHAPAAIARRPAELDWSQARSVRLWVAARGETRLAVGILLVDAANRRAVLESDAWLPPDGRWHEVRAPFEGGGRWRQKSQGDGALDRAHLTVVGVQFVGA